MPDSPQYLIIARILRPHGIRGELALQIITDFPDRIRSLETVYLGSSETDLSRLRPYRVAGARPQKKDSWLLRLEGIEDRDEAEPLRNLYVFVSLSDAVPLDADEVYLFQVMGINVVTTDGEALGRVVDIIETGANDVYVVKGSAYGEVLIPAIESVMLRIDVKSGVMTVAPSPGLLPDRPPTRPVDPPDA